MLLLDSEGILGALDHVAGCLVGSSRGTDEQQKIN